jgi:hypothetical protein
MAAIVRPGYSLHQDLLRIIAMVVLDALLLWIGIESQAQLRKVNALYSCIDGEAVKVIIGLESLLFGLMVSMQLSLIKLPGKIRLLATLFLLAGCFILETYFLMSDYTSFKRLLTGSEDTWTVSQLLNLTTAFFPPISIIWTSFGITGISISFPFQTLKLISQQHF